MLIASSSGSLTRWLTKRLVGRVVCACEWNGWRGVAGGGGYREMRRFHWRSAQTEAQSGGTVSGVKLSYARLFLLYAHLKSSVTLGGLKQKTPKQTGRNGCVKATLFTRALRIFHQSK